MSNSLDFTRLSNLVDAVASRKFVAVAGTLTSSTGYLTGLVTTATTQATASAASATTSQASAADAASAAASSLTVLNRFTSTYLGIQATDPVRSSLGNDILVGAIYIRSSDGRVRFCNSLATNGTPIFADATVAADSASIVSAGRAYFLTLASTTLQTVASAVTFTGAVVGPLVTDWTSRQLVTAVDLQTRLTTSNSSLAAEVTRATAAETALGNSKVDKTGSTMTGALTITSNEASASLVILNNSSNRQYKINVTNDARWRLVDDTSNSERLYVTNTGVVVIPGSLTVVTAATITDLAINRTDGGDPGINFQQSAISRWQLRRSNSAGRLYIARMNSSGAYVDSPWYINETDGSIVQNGTTFNGGVNVRGATSVNANGAFLTLNNTSGVYDSAVIFSNANYTRWIVGRGAGADSFYINRYNDTGGYVGTPLFITGTDGAVSIQGPVINITGPVINTHYVQTPSVLTTSNGAGTNVKIGDDCWIGDVNIPNTVGFRGNQDATAGFVTFGNSGNTLGCNGGDGTLRYAGNPIYHSGNVASMCSSGSIDDGSGNTRWWRMGPDGFVIQGGRYRRNLGDGVNASITLLKPLSAPPLSGTPTPYDPSNTYNDVHVAFAGSTSTTVTFRAIRDDSGGGYVNFDWVCYGYA